MKALLFTALVFASPVIVDGQSITTLPPGAAVTAAQVRRDGDLIRLRGDVTITSPTAEIRANEADVHTGGGVMEAELRGNVRVKLVNTTLTPEQRAVMDADETYRLAKLNADIPAMDRILAAEFSETNQNGNTRNKTQTIDLWRSFRIDALTTDSFGVRVLGDTSIVAGTQTENRSERMLFSRTYVHTSTGWQLVQSTQFRDPRGAARTQ